MICKQFFTSSEFSLQSCDCTLRAQKTNFVHFKMQQFQQKGQETAFSCDWKDKRSSLSFVRDFRSLGQYYQISVFPVLEQRWNSMTPISFLK